MIPACHELQPSCLISLLYVQGEGHADHQDSRNFWKPCHQGEPGYGFARRRLQIFEWVMPVYQYQGACIILYQYFVRAGTGVQ